VAVEVAVGLDPFYTGFYLAGLRKRFGRIRWVEPQVPLPGWHPMITFVAEGRRVAIDAGDKPLLYGPAHDWCDVYGKVNAVADSPDKVRPIGPSFGMRMGSTAFMAASVLRALAQAGDHRDQLLRGFGRQWRHAVAESSMRPGTSEDGYVFFVSSIWARDEVTNMARWAFMDAAERHATFEGGFAPRSDGATHGIETKVMPHRVPYRDYLARTRRSAVVFSTPAVGQCHGWKLPEYLALGKAIIQTPLSRLLPAPLEHGVHVHFCDLDEDAIFDAVERVLGDAPYRRRLEVGARRYYDEQLRPEVVIDRLLAS
jgi:hypothetical protein